MSLRKYGAIASLLMAVTYIIGFVYFGAIAEQIDPSDSQGLLASLATNLVALNTIYGLIYLAFGILLAALLLALHQDGKDEHPNLSNYAAIFGLVWVTLVIASGMVMMIGNLTVVEMMDQDMDLAYSSYKIFGTISEALGGGNELVGGLWVFIISLIQFKQSRPFVAYFGFIVGLSGILTIIPDDTMPAVFGLTQIIWFVWISIYLFRK